MDVRLEEVGQAALLPRDQEMAGELEHAGVPVGIVGRRQPQCVLRQLDGGLGGAAPRRARRGGGHGGGQLRVRLRRGQGEVARAQLALGDEAGEVAMERATLGRLRLAHRCGGNQRMRRADVVAVEHEHPGVDREIERVRLRQRRQLRRPGATG